MPPKNDKPKNEEIDLDAQLAKLKELSDEQLTELEASLVAEFDAADKAENGPDVEAMEVVAEKIDQVRAEGEARDAAKVKAEEDAAKIRAKVHVEPKAEKDDEEETETPKAEGDEPDADNAEGEGAEPEKVEEPKAEEPVAETPAEPEAEATTEETPEQIAASAEKPRPTLAQIQARRPKKAEPKPTESTGAQITAAGDVHNTGAGNAFKSMKHMGEAVAQKGRALVAAASSRHRDGKIIGGAPIAHVEWRDEYPDARSLDGDSVGVNSRRVEAIVAALGGMDALTAAGGLCAPVDVRYELFTLGDARRPIRDALVRFGATRGGIQFNEPPTLASVGAGEGVNRYTEADDTSSTGYPKGVFDVACGDLVTREVAAIVTRAKIGNFQRRFNVESWDATWDLLMTLTARVAEDALWDSIETDSTVVETGIADVATGLGTSRAVLRAVALAVQGFRDRHRLPETHPIRVLAPDFVRANAREDLAAQQPGDDALAVADATINGYFTSRGVQVTWSPDAGGQGIRGAQAAGALNPWPDTAQFLIFPEGTHLFLDGGELNFGLEIRDSTLNDTNDVEAMTEIFEETAPVGPESLALTVDICASGATKLPVAFAPCASGS